MFISSVKQPAVRLSLRVPITPTFCENCVPKQIELTLIFISFAHHANKHSRLQALSQRTVTSNWEATDFQDAYAVVSHCSIPNWL